MSWSLTSASIFEIANLRKNKFWCFLRTDNTLRRLRVGGDCRTRIKTYQMIIFDRERDQYAFRGDHSKRLPNQVDSGYNVQVRYYCLVDLFANWKRLYCYQLNRARCFLQLHLYRRAIYWEDLMISHNRTNAYLLGRLQEEEVRNHPLHIFQRLQPMLIYQRIWNSTKFHQSFEDRNHDHNLNEKLRRRFDVHDQVTPETKKNYPMRL